MGQYHLIVNLDKREFLDPHRLGDGLKAFEQLANFPSTPQALFVLLLHPEPRGGGDLERHPAIGRWRGDRIAVIGDYAEDNDFAHAGGESLSEVYGLCRRGAYRDVTADVAPVLAKELGVLFTVGADGYVMRSAEPAAPFSVLKS